MFVMVNVSNSTRIATIVLTATLVFLAAIAGPVGAQSDQPEWADDMYAQLEGMVGTYNENIDASDLGVAGDQLKNEKVNLVVTDTDGTEATASFRMDGDLQIQELKQGTRDDATMKMTTDRATLTGIVESNDPSAAFQNAITGGDITIDGLGTVNAVKWVVINTLVSLFG